ncbi:hypothetical protein GF312_19855 [Candidatus Poribacteria bacterium]|nr:hypothetical protein [Candidatus Poribacteria bacterium]
MPERKYLGKIILLILLSLLVWTFIICFPNPYVFVRNIYRYFRPPIDPSIIKIIQTEIPDNPSEIHRFVLKTIKYKYDWENYGVPDYVSTARQAVEKRSGDCEDRAVVLASLLDAKNIQYEFKASLTHYWVDYPGKKVSRIENRDVQIFSKKDGKYRIKLPDMAKWKHYIQATKKGIWDVMPKIRKILMLSGWLLIPSIFIVLEIIKRRKTVN